MQKDCKDDVSFNVSYGGCNTRAVHSVLIGKSGKVFSADWKDGIAFSSESDKTYFYECPANYVQFFKSYLACPANSNSPAGSLGLTRCNFNAGSTGPNGGPCAVCVAGKYKVVTGFAVSTDCPANCVLSLYSSTICARLFALVAAKPSFASVSTRSSAPVGSVILPVYVASDGPQGKGQVTCDRTKSQYLDAGARTLNIATNGDLTIVTVVRFTETVGNWKRIIDLGSGAGDNNLVVTRSWATSNLQVDFRNGGPDVITNKSSSDVIVQNSWLTVVTRYRASTREYWWTVNNVGDYAGNVHLRCVCGRRVPEYKHNLCHCRPHGVGRGLDGRHLQSACREHFLDWVHCPSNSNSSVGRAAFTRCVCSAGYYQRLDPIADILNLYPAYLVSSTESWDSSQERLLDLSGSRGVGMLQTDEVSIGNVTGNGAFWSVPYVGGTTGTQFSWGSVSIPSNFTICSITRYSGEVKRRILHCKDRNWLHGHWMGNTVTYYDDGGNRSSMVS
jgi:hypothetical protein